MSPDISSQPSSSCQQDVFVLNMAEYNQIKIKHNEIFQALTIYDCGADSSFITSSLASRLPHHFKADVTLQLKTIPGYQEFKTIQHEVEILVNGSTRRILCYECPVSIGSLQQLKGLEARLSLSLGQPINIPYGQVDLLLGLKNISLFPVDIQLQPSPVEFLDLRLYLSSTTSNHIVAGAVSRAFIRGPTLPGGQSVDKEFFTVSDMMTILMKEGDLEVAPLQCEPCQQRTKNCARCKLEKKPISIQNQRERQMIRNALKFDKENGVIETSYHPTQSDLNTIFPPRLSNKRNAASISRKVFQRLKKTGKLQLFQDAFQKFIDLGYIRILSEEEIRSWEDKNLAVSYCSIHGVAKEVTDESKQGMRIVLNASLQRKCVLNGKITTASLNSVLPQGQAEIANLVDILIQWMSKEFSLTFDMIKAYNCVLAGKDEESQKMVHTRRVIWFVGDEDNPQEVTAAFQTVMYGDRPASAILEEVKMKIGDELLSEGFLEASRTLVNHSYVDDTVKAFDEKQEAFDVYEQNRKAMSKYGIKLHEPVISSSQGKLDSVEAEPRSKPNEDEPSQVKFFGLHYSPFQDKVTIKMERNLHRAKGQKGAGNSITMRSFCSFTHATWDPLGFFSPVTCQGKLALAHIQAVLPPTCADNWNKPLTGEILEEALRYIEMIQNMEDLSFARAPPSRGELTEIHLHHDAGEELFAVGVWGIFVDKKGKRHSKLMYSRSRLGKRSIPDNELNSACLASTVGLNLISILPSVKRMRFFGDSSATQAQLCSIQRPKCVFTKNRLVQVTSNTRAIIAAGVDVSFNLVSSENNAIDKATKIHNDAVQHVKAASWLRGPKWAQLEEKQWPVTKVIKLKDDLFEEDAARATVFLASNQDPEKNASGDVEIEKNKMMMKSKDKLNNNENLDDGDIKDANAEVSIFAQLVENVSVPRKAVRTVARIIQMAKEKSFRGLKKEPSLTDEKEAWVPLARDLQRTMDESEILQPRLLPFKENRCVFTRQRWEPKTHKEIFHCDKMPVLTVSSRIGSLLINSAHRAPVGPCKSDVHATVHLKSSQFPAFLVGNINAQLTKVRKACVSCRKKSMMIKGREDTVYSPQMAPDRFKNPFIAPWSKIAVDLIAPVLTFDRPERTSRSRPKPRYKKKAILVIVDTTGIGATRFVLMSDQSASSFCIALKQHIALCQQVPEVLYSDKGSIFVAASKKEHEKKECEGVDVENDQSVMDGIDIDEVKNKVKRFYPTIKFEIATGGSQAKNAICEEKVKQFKLYLKNVLNLKPNSPVPSFQNEDLNLILCQCASTLNSRPLTFIKNSPNCPISANHFVCPDFQDQEWTDNVSIPQRAQYFDEYRQRMQEELVKAMRGGSFLPSKWKEEGLLPKLNDIVFVLRGANKVSKLGKMEYGKIISVSQDSRKVMVDVCRSESKQIKTVEADARNCRLVYRPDNDCS
jgi:hypothetical protein